MLDRFGPARTVLVAAGAVLAALAAGAPAAAAVSPGTIGGARLAGRGVIVNYSSGIPKLPGLKASAWIVADAGTGQVLAARDPHGWPGHGDHQRRGSSPAG
jgi:D-alanyl-D-alanine carboxypeptidase (penicillin-binding protein 5/6)